MAALCLAMTGCATGGSEVPPTPTLARQPTQAAVPPTSISTPTPAVPTPTLPVVRPTATSGARQATVDIRDNHFIPSDLTIPAGTRVQWMNNGENVHDVVAKDGSFISNTLGTGARFAYTFQIRGQYAYFCTPHMAEGMIGEITVE